MLLHEIQVINGFKILYKVCNENMEMNLFTLIIIKYKWMQSQQLTLQWLGFMAGYEG